MQAQWVATRLNIYWWRGNRFGPRNDGMQLIRRCDEDMHHEVATRIGKRLCHGIPECVEGGHYAAYRGLSISSHHDTVNDPFRERIR
jgi:hypothetical protein